MYNQLKDLRSSDTVYRINFKQGKNCDSDNSE